MSHLETKLENPYPRGGVSFVSFPWIDQYTKKEFWNFFLKKGVVSRVLGEVLIFCVVCCVGDIYMIPKSQSKAKDSRCG